MIIGVHHNGLYTDNVFLLGVYYVLITRLMVN